MAHFGASAPQCASGRSAIILQILTHPDLEVVPQSRQSFLDALALYEAKWRLNERTVMPRY